MSLPLWLTSNKLFPKSQLHTFQDLTPSLPLPWPSLSPCKSLAFPYLNPLLYIPMPLVPLSLAVMSNYCVVSLPLCHTTTITSLTWIIMEDRDPALLSFLVLLHSQVLTMTKALPSSLLGDDLFSMYTHQQHLNSSLFQPDLIYWTDHHLAFSSLTWARESSGSAITSFLAELSPACSYLAHSHPYISISQNFDMDQSA